MCPSKCSEKMHETTLYTIWGAIRNLSIDGFNKFLSDHEKLTTEVIKTNKDAKSRARCTYFLPSRSGLVEVCEVTFMNTLYGDAPKSGRLVDKTSKKPLDTQTQPSKRDVENRPLKRKQQPQSQQETTLCFEVEYLDGILDAADKESQLDGGEKPDLRDLEQLLDLNPIEAVSCDESLELSDSSEVCIKDEPTFSESELVVEPLPTYADERRKLKERGLSYTSRTGRVVRARRVKPPCSCKNMCGDKIATEERQQILKDLLELSLKEQRTYITSLIRRTTSARRKGTRRTFTNFYYLPLNDDLVKVCRIMFERTFDTSERMIRTISRKIEVERSTSNIKLCTCPSKQCYQTIPEDERGRIMTAYQKLPPQEKPQFVRKHIKKVDVAKLKNSKIATPKSVGYFLLINSKWLKVCKPMFSRTFDMTLEQVTELLKRKDLTSPLDAMDFPHCPDIGRIKLTKKQLETLSKDDLDSELVFFKEHIDGYPKHTSHYCSESKEIQKLLHLPNVVCMYNEYLLLCKDSAATPVMFQNYFEELSRQFVEASLQLPTRCEHCGFFETSEGARMSHNAADTRRDTTSEDSASSEDSDEDDSYSD